MKRAAFLVLLCCAMTACGKPDLTRQMAEGKILESDTIQIARSEITYASNAHAMAEEQGIWRPDGGTISLMRRELDTLADIQYGRAKLRKPVQLKVLATGISEVPGTSNLKEVRFDFEYEGVPPPLARFLSKGGSGTAVFRLFDDGWRAEKVDSNQQPFVLT